mmetsp:Transcript_65907/g.157582  ORF Transcript_65907/g.157582 Transcript_65907/m.157582 type:complete len:737 (+) Transcript_65907:28-2238(+)
MTVHEADVCHHAGPTPLMEPGIDNRGSDAFEDLLTGLRKVHTDALHSFELQNQSLRAEILALRKAQAGFPSENAAQTAASDSDVEQQPQQPSKLRLEPGHTALPETSFGRAGSREWGVLGDPDAGFRLPGSATFEFHEVASTQMAPIRSVQGVRDPDMIKQTSEKLLKLLDQKMTDLQTSFVSTLRNSTLNTSAFRKFFKRLRTGIQSSQFDVFCAFVMLVNAVSVGVEVQLAATGKDIPVLIPVLDVITLAWYTMELALRLWADRLQRDVFWNFFDALTILACIADLALSSDSTSSNYAIVRFLRFVRVARALRMIKIGEKASTYFIVFSKMTYCMLQSFPSVVSAATVIGLFTYITAVYLTQAVSDMTTADPMAPTNAALTDNYGSLDRAFFSLLKAVFTGQAWDELVQPLSVRDGVSASVFVAYVLLTLLCILNVIQGIFVDNALQSTAHYKELMIAEAHKRRIILLQHLQQVFAEIDTDGSGVISVEEFEACLCTAGGRAFFEVMGLSTVQAKELFRLIDTDGSQAVDIDEFCSGCLRVMGEARNFDMQCVIAENRALIGKWTHFLENFEACIKTCVLAVMNVAEHPGQKSEEMATMIASLSCRRVPSPAWRRGRQNHNTGRRLSGAGLAFPRGLSHEDLANKFPPSNNFVRGMTPEEAKADFEEAYQSFQDSHCPTVAPDVPPSPTGAGGAGRPTSRMEHFPLGQQAEQAEPDASHTRQFVAGLQRSRQTL